MPDPLSSQSDSMGVLAHWTLVANDRTGEPFDLIRDEQHAEAMRAGGWKLIEVVPAEQLRGAVEDRAKIERAAVLAAAEWLERGAPIAAKWLRDDYLPTLEGR